MQINWGAAAAVQLNNCLPVALTHWGWLELIMGRWNAKACMLVGSCNNVGRGVAELRVVEVLVATITLLHRRRVVCPSEV